MSRTIKPELAPLSIDESIDLRSIRRCSHHLFEPSANLHKRKSQEPLQDRSAQGVSEQRLDWVPEKGTVRLAPVVTLGRRR